MGVKHKLKRIKKQLNLLSQQSAGIAAGLAQMRVLTEKHGKLLEQHTTLLQHLSTQVGGQSLATAAEPKAGVNQSDRAETANSTATAIAQQTETAKQQAALLQLQTENLSRLLAMLEHRDQPPA